MDDEAVQDAKLDQSKPASSLERYFEYIEMAGELKAKCRLGCSKVIPRKKGHTNSMRWHLETRHKGPISEYINAIRKKDVPTIDEMSRAALYEKLDLTKPADSTN